MLHSMRNKISSLTNHAGFRRYAANTSWLFGEKILRIIVGLFVAVWVARYLGPEEFGLFSYAQSFVGLFAAFATLGLDGIIVRELVKDESRIYELIGTAFWLKVVGAFAVLIILVFAIQFTSNDSYTNTLVFIIASATIFQSFNVVDFYFQSKVLSKYVVYANVISLLLSSLIKVLLILNDAPLIAFVWAVLFDSVVLALGLIYFFFRCSELNIKYLTFNKIIAAIILKDGFFYMFTAFIIAFYMQIDQVMIKAMLGNAAVGQYSVAAKLSELWYFLPLLLSRSLYPAIENAKKISNKFFYERLEKLFVLCHVLALLIVIPTLFLSDTIVFYLYGSDYMNAAPVLVIHIISLIFAFQRIPSEYWVLSENLKYFEILKTFSGLIVNVFLNILLIKHYGIKGAAIATLISMMITSYISYGLYYKSRVVFVMMSKTILLLNFKSIFK